MKILDFGLAALARDPRLAPKGAVFGTPEYMSPEQARGEDATAQCDLYALGVLFFEMLTGQLPVPLATTARRCSRCSAARRRRGRRAMRPDVAPQAEAIVLRLLEKDAAQALPGRPPSAGRAEGAPALAAVEAAGTARRAKRRRSRRRPRRRRSPPASSSGRTRAALFSRMVARAYPNGNAAARAADRARHSRGSSRRAQRGSRARSRATRASSRRSSAAVARCAPRSAARSRSSRHEESRALREATDWRERIRSVESELRSRAARARGHRTPRARGRDARRRRALAAPDLRVRGRGARDGRGAVAPDRTPRRARHAPRRRARPSCANRSTICAASCSATPTRSRTT